MTFNSRRAQELGKWAEEQGRGDAFHRMVFHTYFAEGENFARRKVLADICRRVGLDEAAAMETVEKRIFAEAVDRDWRRSRHIGIQAVPALWFRNGLLVGAQPYAIMKGFIRNR
jgi:predicted DsbA family dithiol-disulfide isomerase